MRILSNAATVMLLTVPEAKMLARLLSAQVEGLHSVVTVPELSAGGAIVVRPLYKRTTSPCCSTLWEYRES